MEGNEDQLYFELQCLVDDYLKGIIDQKEYEELSRRIMEDLEDYNDA